MYMDFHKYPSESSILCLLTCLKPKVPKTKVSIFWWFPLLLLQVIIFHIIFTIIQATNLQTKFKKLLAYHLHPVSKSQRIQLLERFGLPSYTLLYSLFISNSDYSNSFLTWTTTKMRICNFSNLYHHCTDMHILFLLSIPNSYYCMIIIINQVNGCHFNPFSVMLVISKRNRDNLLTLVFHP